MTTKNLITAKEVPICQKRIEFCKCIKIEKLQWWIDKNELVRFNTDRWY